MSNIYIQEPPTNGKVLLVTSLGDIDVELWSKESPKACRNFLQLCLEGYYDGTKFHRVVREFIAQGGDRSGSGSGGESVYGEPFRVERHSRLRFVRRGLVATANADGITDDCASQFFFTLSPAPELQDKHTIFGKVAGDTLYNMLKFNDVVIGSDDTPLSPPYIIKTEILSNPFDDIVPREIAKKVTKDKEGKRKSKSKATKDFKLLSFGSEAEEDEAEVDQITKEVYSGKSKSIHDLVDDQTLSKEPLIVEGEKKRQADLESVRQKLKRKATEESVDSDMKVENDNNDGDNTGAMDRDTMRRETKQLKRELVGKTKSSNSSKDSDDANSIIAEYREQKAPYVERKREMKKGSKASRENETLALLARFEGKLHHAEPVADAVDDNITVNVSEEQEIRDLTWTKYKLVAPGIEGSTRHARDANMPAGEDRYDIHDPRNEITKRRREKSKQIMKQGKDRQER